MSGKKTFFSIVIPTRNRGNLLQFAVKSILAQSFRDFELIISDNFSTDNTSEIVHAFNDERIKYFRSDKSLTMNESYKFALSHASGKYITFLSDDDAFTINAFETAKKIIDETKTKLLIWNYAYYYLNERFQPVDYPPFHPLYRIKSNTILIPTFCNKLFKVGADETINRILLHDTEQNYSLTNPDYRAAFLTNAFYHHEIFEEIENKGLDLFPNYVIPDIYAFIITLCVIESYLYLDAPLTLFCKSNVSTTESGIDKLAFHNALIVGKKEPFINFAPLKNLTNQNYIIESSLQGLNAVGEKYKKFQLNKKKYYENSFNNFLYYKKHKIDVAQELEELYSAVEESEELDEKISFKISNGNLRKVLGLLRKLPRPAFITRRMAYSRPELIHTRTIIIQGENDYFDDIADCAGWLNSDNIKRIAGFCLAIADNKKEKLPFRWQID